MTIAFLSNKSDGVVTVLKSIKDSLDLVGGRDLIDFLSETRERSEFFDRLVVSENALTSGNEEQDFMFLKDYIESYSPNLEVVMAISRESGSSLADSFTNIFSAPMYTVAYLPEKTSTGVLIEMVDKPILEIKAKYFSIDNSQVKAKEAFAKVEKSKPKKQKSGFFGKLFGGKKEEEEVKEEVEVSKEDVAEERKELVNSFYHPEGGVVSAPVVATPVSTPDLVAPTAPSGSSAVIDSEVKESINKLFGGIGTEDSLESTGDLSLNFSDYGENHYQTGFIPEDDIELGGSSQEVVVSGQPKESGEWLSVNTEEVGTTVAENPSGSNFSEFSKSSNLGSSVEQDLGTPPSNFLGELPQKFSGVLPTLGVTLVVGDESSSFLANFLKSDKGNYIVDIRKSFDLSSYIDESSYLNSDSDFYEEAGNFYKLGISPKELTMLAKDKVHLIVNASVDNLKSQGFPIGLFDNIVPVFSNNVAKLEFQLLEYEDVSPEVARSLSKSTPRVVGGISKEVTSLLSRAVFSKINWKGLIK